MPSEMLIRATPSTSFGNEHRISSSKLCKNCDFDFGASQNRFQRPPTSLYTYYLNNNAFASADDESMIKTNIFEGLAQMSLIDKKVDRLKELTDLLVEERSRIHEIVKEYRVLLKPIHRLPPELLTRIFLFCTDLARFDTSGGFRGQQPPTSLNPSKYPWALSQVCQSWRRVALSTPKLWTLVSFTFHSEGPDVQSAPALRARCHRLQLQLQRTANQPIDIITQTGDPNVTSIERLLSPLCSYSPNWRHLRIDLKGDMFSPGMSPISGRLQSLESLHVRFIGPIHGRHFDCFRFAPRLRSVIFSADRRISSEIWHPNKFPLPYQQIHHYCLQDSNEDGITVEIRNKMFIFFHRALYLFPALRSCRLFLQSKTIKHYLDLQSTPTFAQGRLTVTFGELTELELDGIDVQSGIHAVLPYIRAPSLTKLAIQSSGPDQAALSAFLLHPQNLTSLEIRRVEMPVHEFSAILSQLTSLQHLSFGVAEIGGITNRYLSILSSVDPISKVPLAVPRLSSLSLIRLRDFPSTYTTEALLSVLLSRWRESSESENSGLVSIRLDKGIDDERLDHLRVEGLQVGLWEEN